MPNNTEIISAARFRAEIAGILGDPWQFFFVSPLVSESGVIETRNGRDEFVRKSPGIVSAADITMRRYYEGNNALYQWRRNIEVGIIDRRSGTITVLDTDRQTIVAQFNFYEAWPRRWSVGPWDASEDSPLVEEVVLAVRNVEQVTA